MRRVNIAAVIATMLLGLTVLGARETLRASGGLARGSAAAAQPAEAEKKLVDFKSDVAYSIKVADSSAICLVGRVVFYHNGAVITCDSAVRYSEKHMECFRNVIVNKDNTYAYGDRADYNGETNRARLYSDIVKVIDGDATLYTYRFDFNTLDNIGIFRGGGVVVQNDNRLESERGYYYASTRDIICVERVEMRNDEYELRSDSVAYNMDTEVAQFFTRSYIWNKEGDILSADVGCYDRAGMVYTFTSNSYVLSGEKEVWADSMDYFSNVREVILRRNVQLNDNEQNMKAFGDFGHYWGEVENAVLTLDPSALGIDAETGDTAFMRADSIFIYTLDPSKMPADSMASFAAPAPGSGAGDSPGGDTGGEAPAGGGDRPSSGGSVSAADGNSDGEGVSEAGDESESESGAAGSAGRPAAANTKAAAKADAARTKAAARAAAERKKAAAREAKRERLRQAAEARAARDSVKQAERRLKAEIKIEAKLEKIAARRGISVDSLRRQLMGPDSAAAAPAGGDTLTGGDSTVVAGLIPGDSLRGDSLAGDSVKVQRILRAYRNVKLYRYDAQAVCDSLVAFTSDSTAHLYIDPVMWNGENQITSDVMDIYTADGKLDKAIFTGTPLMCSQVDTVHFNQIAGKVIEAYFRDNELFRTDVVGNAQALYYMTESGRPGIKGFIVLLSGDMSFYIEDNELHTIVSRVKPDAFMYPMDKIPAEQPELLEIFKWEIERRPSREEVFSRRIKPTQVDYYRNMKRPSFPIDAQMTKFRERLLNEGRWNDRNEPISQDAMDFIRSKGYVPPAANNPAAGVETNN